MPINLNVGSKFNEADARRAMAEAENYYSKKAAELKVQAELDEKSAREAVGEAKVYFERRAVDLRVQAKLDTRTAQNAARDFQRTLSGLTPAVDGATGSFSQLGAVMGAVGKVGTPVLLVGLASAMVEVAGVAASAAQSIALIPAAAGAAAAGIGTLNIATLGFGDALDSMGDPAKFAQALQNLAPSAQQAATSIRALVEGPLKGLQQATQQSLFAGVGEQLTALTTQYLPSIQAMTTGIADSFNQMFQGVTDQLMTPETQGAMQQFMNNTVAAFQQLAPAVAPLTKAFADLMAVGSDFLPDLASAAADAANAFSKFISEARQSGELKKFMGEGLDTLKQLGQVAWEVGKAFMALAPTGREVLPTIKKLLEGINDIMPAISGAAALLGPSFGAWTAALTPISGMITGISKAWDAVAAHVIPVVNSITAAVNALTEPIRYLMSLVGVDVPPIPAIQQPSAQVSGQGSTVSDNRTSRPRSGMDPALTLPAAPKPGWGLPDRRTGWNPQATYSPPTTSGGGSAAPSFTAPASRTVPSGHVEDTHGALVPNAAALKDLIKQVFPAVTSIGGYRSPDGYNEHSSGEALDIMVGGNAALGNQVNQFLLQNADALGLQYDIWQQQMWYPGKSPTGMGDRGSPTQNHMDHVHARVQPGPAASGTFTSPTSPDATVLPANPAISGVQQVYVVNFDQMMTGSGQPGQFATGGGAGPGAGGPGGGAPGQFDPLGSFFSGLQQGGGIPGIVGSIGSNILGQVRQQSFDSGGDLQPGITIAHNNTGRPEQVTRPNAPAIGSSFGATPQGGIGQNTSPGSLADKGATSVGGVDKPSTPGGGQSGGGLAGAATSAAATAADMFAPGSGAAVQIASQEIQRAIKFAGQVTAIGVNGLMETFLPMGASDLAQNNWLTRIAGGFSGVQPQIANTAGKSASVDEMNKKGAQAGQAAPVALPPPLSSGQGSGKEPGPPINVTYNNNGAPEDRAAKDLTWHLQGMHTSPSTQR